MNTNYKDFTTNGVPDYSKINSSGTFTNLNINSVFQPSYIETPKCWITQNKNRKKNIDNIIYLEDNSNFELEFHNSSIYCYKIEISINGNLISASGIIINPGQRIYLDRFIDTNNKFLFKTYDIENTFENKKAISNNGKIEINYYQENYIIATYNNFDHTYRPDTVLYTYDTNNIIGTNTSINSAPLLNNIETGRIEKGEISNTEFTYINKQFNYYSTKKDTFTILPLSTKPLETKDLIQKCSKCKSKIKKEWKFCSHCGNDLTLKHNNLITFKFFTNSNSTYEYTINESDLVIKQLDNIKKYTLNNINDLYLLKNYEQYNNFKTHSNVVHSLNKKIIITKINDNTLELIYFT